ncbi:MAG: tripartite tricarboxylate transporter substrate binding protein [Burkholderiaceae bacterium]|nr:tripartite tricarboxylate transporter substrate binding protein [Burkholderiaceae bacterium]
MKLIKLIGVLAVVQLCWMAGPAMAQSYPAKPLRIVVPFAPGGATDVVARMVAQRLNKAWGQPVVVENRPGAAGNIAAQHVAKSPPDGYTLLATAAGLMTVNQFIYNNPGFDPVADLAPITNVANAPHLLVTSAASPIATVQDLVAAARARPGTISFGNSGAGSASHLTAEYFAATAKVQVLHVPYKGSSPAITDLLGGQITAMTDAMVGLLPQIEAKRLRPVAVASLRRFPLLPDVPTVAESGLPGFENGTWLGILAPAGTPREIREKIQREIAEMLKSPDIQRELLQQGMTPVGNTPEQFAAFMQTERQKAARIVEVAKIPKL